MWFAGVPSYVGGKFEDHRLSDLALRWAVDEATSVGLVLDDKRYKKQIGVDVDRRLPDDHALGEIHTNGIGWPYSAGAGTAARSARVTRCVQG